jgi:hypothetical protein
MKTLGYGVTALAVSIVPVEYPALLGFVIILADVFCALMLVLGGLMLVLGFWSRWVALAALPFVLGVVLKHLPKAGSSPIRTVVGVAQRSGPRHWSFRCCWVTVSILSARFCEARLGAALSVFTWSDLIQPHVRSHTSGVPA